MNTRLEAALAALLLAIAASAAAQEQPPPAAPAQETGDLALDELLADAPAEPAEPAADEPAPPPAAVAEPQASPEELPTIAVEQKPEASPAPLKEPSARAQIEEIVVTATKREQSIREIPASIAALSGDDLERSGAAGVEDIAKLVPGVNVALQNGIQRVTIRGIAAANNTSSTTGTLFGNISFTDAFLPVMSLDPQPFDLQGVEVLKGPQGTLFGASALNGAIRYVPTAPVLGEFSMKYFAEHTQIAQGDTGLSYGAAVNLPAGETLALRVVAFDRKSPGYVDNLRTGVDDSNELRQHGLRGMLAWKPDGRWSVSLIAAMQKTEQDDSVLVDNLEGRLSSNNRPRPDPSDKEYQLAGLTIERSFDWAQLISESSWVGKLSHTYLETTRSQVPNAAVPLIGVNGGGESDTWSQEFRLVSEDDPGSPWRWIAGVSTYRQNLKTLVNLAAGNSPLPPNALDFLDALIPGLGSLVDENGNVSLVRLEPDMTIRETALFGNLTRRLGEDWELTLGGRLYKTRSSGSNPQTGLVFTVINANPNYVEYGDVREQGFNPQVSLSWRATDEVLAYATVSRGFRVGGLQPGVTLPTSNSQAPPTFKSDVIWNYEAGVRTEWFERSLTMDATAFHIDWQEPQTEQPDSTTGLVYLDNAGGVESNGVDFALQWVSPFGFTLGSSATWTRTETTEDFQTGSGRVAMAGTPWPYSPEVQTATTLSYPLELTDWRITPALTHTYIGKAINHLGEQRPIFDYQQLDAQLAVSTSRWRWAPQITVNVNNILDERGLTADIKQGNVRDVIYSQPRTLIVRISGSF